MEKSKQTWALLLRPGDADMKRQLRPLGVYSSDIFISYLIAHWWLRHLRFYFAFI